MKRLVSATQPWLSLAALALIVAPSIWTPGQLLGTAVDGPHILARLYEINALLDQGVLWPRWAPNWSYGYGYPIMHFYGSLSFYPSLILHRLGLPLLTALQSGFWLALVCSGWAAFAWLRAVLSDERAAWLGAAAYLFIPYHLNAVVYRVNLPEPWAMVWVPLLLYGLSRMAHQVGGASVGLTALAAAALPLTNNPATLVCAPLVLSYALFLLWRSSQRWSLLRGQAAAAGLALGIAAFFVVPAFIDRHAVYIERGWTPGGLNVLNNFLPLVRLFQQPFSTDISRANPQYDPLSLGAVVLPAALLLLVVGWRRLSRSERWLAGWAAVTLVGSLWLCTAASAPVYRLLSGLRVLQFPWRFLIPAMLPATLLVGLGGAACLRLIGERWRNLALAGSVTGLVLSSWPLLYPGLYRPMPANPTLAQIAAMQAGMVCTITTTAEYTPVTAHQIPTDFPLRDDYVSGRPVIRWDVAGLPADGQTLSIEDTGLWARWEVDTPQGFAAVYRAFVFRGWQATVDGRRVEIEIAQPYGLIQIAVPTGRHVIEVRWGSTPDRIAASVLSILSLIAAVGLLWVKNCPASADQTPDSGAWRSGLWLGSVGLILFVARAGLVDRLGLWPHQARFDEQVLRGLAHPTQIAFSGGQRLLGYELLDRAAAGRSFDLDLYWATDTGQPFRALVRLVDEQGMPWSDWDRVVDFPGLIGPPGTWEWGWRYTSLRYRLDVPPGTPPGVYRLSVSVIQPDTRAPFYVSLGVPLNAERTDAILGDVVVQGQSLKADAVAALAGPQGLVSWGNGLNLVRCQAGREYAQVGEQVALTWLWYAAQPGKVGQLAQTLELKLLNAGGQAGLELTLPLSPRYPTAQWRRGDLVRDQTRVRLPADLSAGTWHWVIQSGRVQSNCGTLTVSLPARRLDVPDNLTPLGQVFDGWAELIGYRLDKPRPGQPCSIALYWRAQATTAVEYKVFIHLVGPQGHVLAQSDAVPSAWTRPTTGWLSPEVIADIHTLNLPADLQGLEWHVGLYDPLTGRRAQTADRQDHVVISMMSKGNQE